MSTVIHQKLKKKFNETTMVLLTIDFWSNRQMNSYIGLGLTVHLISNSKLHNAMLAFLADDRKPQLEEIVSKF